MSRWDLSSSKVFHRSDGELTAFLELRAGGGCSVLSRGESTVKVVISGNVRRTERLRKDSGQ